MHGYSNGSSGTSITFHNNGYLEASMQGYNKGNKVAYLMVHNNAN
jgi:hypothetical protein